MLNMEQRVILQERVNFFLNIFFTITCKRLIKVFQNVANLFQNVAN